MINFHHEDVALPELDFDKVTDWLNELAKEQEHHIEEINYIFCSDEYLLQVNREYLNHDYYTDIITFDNSEEEGEVMSDIFISLDRVKDHGNEFGDGYERELLRVIAHGLLHLIGFNDKSDEQQEEMTKMENYAVNKFIEK